jgi:hypothetical protein
MELPFQISPALIVFLMVLLFLYRSLKQRARDENEEDPRPKVIRRGPGMMFSAGRDAAQQNARFQQVFIPMEPEEEPALRDFYLQKLGLTEMRSPNYPTGQDGFWAVSGTRQIYFGTQPNFPFDVEALPSFPISDLDSLAEHLAQTGHAVAWDRSVPYVQCLVVTDPAGTQIALIGA